MAAADLAECRDKHQDAKTVRERDARIMVDASDLVPRRPSIADFAASALGALCGVLAVIRFWRWRSGLLLGAAPPRAR
jgi:hypothetical protein